MKAEIYREVCSPTVAYGISNISGHSDSRIVVISKILKQEYIEACQVWEAVQNKLAALYNEG